MKNKIYIHYNNNKLYKVISEVKIQVNDIWVPAILYKEKGKKEKYVRELQEFLLKFDEYFELQLPKGLKAFAKNLLEQENNLDEFLNCDNESLVNYHFGLGTMIRYKYNLWRDKKINKIFKNYYWKPHPDDASFEIIKYVQRELKNDKAS